MKTVVEYFNELPEPYRSQAIENSKSNFTQDVVVVNLEAAISGAFTWEHSPQGREYWADLVAKLPKGIIEELETISESMPVKTPSDSMYLLIIKLSTDPASPSKQWIFTDELGVKTKVSDPVVQAYVESVEAIGKIIVANKFDLLQIEPMAKTPGK